tara:strand:+ start:477 stop:1214 length:738 start_codon:yes stop_codon:yes gene_type:complete
MKYLLKQIDKKLFNEFLIKIYRNLYTNKKTRNFHKNYVTNINNLRQYKSLTYWNNLFNHLSKNNVPGDIVECGVGNGQSLSFILFNLIYSKEHLNRKYIGFDSFQGFPEPSEEDNSRRNPKKGDWSHTNEKFVLGNLNDLGFDDKNYAKIKFIKGFYENSFKREYDNIKKISILHIDCDLYSSTKISLETWFSKVETNGIIVFDEYLNAATKFPGAVKAIDDFLGDDKNKIKICPYTKQYYFIKI